MIINHRQYHCLNNLTQEICQDAQEGETHLEEDAGDHPYVNILDLIIIDRDVIIKE